MTDTVNGVLKAYAASKSAHAQSTLTMKEKEVAAFRALPTFASGNTFTTVERSLAAIDETLPKLLAPSAPTLSRNILVGLVSERTNSDDLAKVIGLTNRFTALQVGIPAQKALLAKFAGTTLDDWADTLKESVSAQDEIDAINAKLATLEKQHKKLRARKAELVAGMAEEVF
jgi:hypothetical protein